MHDNHHKRLKIGFLSTLVLQDKRSSWNLTNQYMMRVLEKYCGDVTYIQQPHLRSLLLGKLFNKGMQLLFKKSFMYYHSFFIARRFAKAAGKLFAGRQFDVIVAPSCGTEIAFLHTATPIVLIEDATFALLHNYYPQFRNLMGRSIYEAHTLEGLAIQKAALVLYTSRWAANSAIEHYHADERKVKVATFGANSDHLPASEIVQARKKSDRCRLFFLGTDWQRKGGVIAFETLVVLEKLGIEAELIVCGCVPPREFAHPSMKVIPFLDKSDELQRKELDRLFETSDFMILPTRNDCVPMVFSEASAFGLPVITTNTGGVPGIITEGENGFMLPLSARGPEYADLIAGIYRDDQRYAELVASTRAAFEKRLNWDAWGMSVTHFIYEMLGQEEPMFTQMQALCSMPDSLNVNQANRHA